MPPNVKRLKKPYSLFLENSTHQWRSLKPIKLVWTDPPFGTGKEQEQGGRAYADVPPEAAVTITVEAIRNLYGNLREDSVVCICADYRIIHDVICCIGGEMLYFQGEVIWTFGLGRPRTNWWPNRHNTIATFTVSEKLPAFDATAVPREVRRAKSPGYPDDKPAGSVWDRTMSNSSPERVGYPNQKPMDIIKPFILAHTQPGDRVADPFMGSASTGEAAVSLGRRFVGQDMNPEALKVARRRLRPYAQSFGKEVSR